ncbi:hypothetical protein MP228_002047 [Amoeboaphelidium protococcarum]|nr:hypothetical protein MP228_002047 [Amoeboaphelidium protococcarum]
MLCISKTRIGWAQYEEVALLGDELGFHVRFDEYLLGRKSQFCVIQITQCKKQSHQSYNRDYIPLIKPFSKSILDLYTNFALNLVLVQMDDAAMFYRSVAPRGYQEGLVSPSEVSQSDVQDDILTGDFEE